MDSTYSFDLQSLLNKAHLWKLSIKLQTSLGSTDMDLTAISFFRYLDYSVILPHISRDVIKSEDDLISRSVFSSEYH